MFHMRCPIRPRPRNVTARLSQRPNGQGSAHNGQPRRFGDGRPVLDLFDAAHFSQFSKGVRGFSSMRGWHLRRVVSR
jgi:hypothetical protein